MPNPVLDLWPLFHPSLSLQGSMTTRRKRSWGCGFRMWRAKGSATASWRVWRMESCCASEWMGTHRNVRTVKVQCVGFKGWEWAFYISTEGAGPPPLGQPCCYSSPKRTNQTLARQKAFSVLFFIAYCCLADGCHWILHTGPLILLIPAILHLLY